MKIEAEYQAVSAAAGKLNTGQDGEGDHYGKVEAERLGQSKEWARSRFAMKKP